MPDQILKKTYLHQNRHLYTNIHKGIYKAYVEYIVDTVGEGFSCAGLDIMTSLFLITEYVWCASYPLTYSLNTLNSPFVSLSICHDSLYSNTDSERCNHPQGPKPAFHRNLERPANFIVSFLDYS